MNRTKMGNRVLAWVCVVMMLVMMLPLSGFGAAEDASADPAVTESPVFEQETAPEVVAEVAVTELESEPESAEEKPAESVESETEIEAAEAIVSIAAAATLFNEAPLALDGAGEGVTISVKPAEGLNAVEDKTVNPKDDDTYDDVQVTLTTATHFTLSADNVAVTANDVALTPNVDYKYEVGTLTIYGTALTGDIEVTAIPVEDAYVTVSFELEKIAISGQSAGEQKVYLSDSPYTVTLVAEDNYTLPASITISGDDGYSYDSSTGALSIPVKADSAVAFSASGVEDYYYAVTITGTNFALAQDSATKLYPTPGGTLKLVADSYYDLPTNIELTIENDSFTNFSYADGAVTISAAELPALTSNGTIEISGDATETVYTVSIKYADASISSIKRDGNSLSVGDTLEGDYYTVTNDGSATTAKFNVTHSTGFVIDFRAADKKQLPTSVDLSIDHSYTTESEDWFWNCKPNKTATLTVESGNVVEDVSVLLNVDAQKYAVQLVSGDANDENTNIEELDSGHQSVTDNTEYTVTLNAENGYSLPTTVGISVIDDGTSFEKTLEKSEYDWEPATGVLTIPAEKVFGEITISAKATLNIEGNFTISPDGPNGANGWYSSAVTIKPVAPATKVSIDGENFFNSITIGGTEDDAANGIFADGAYGVKHAWQTLLPPS